MLRDEQPRCGLCGRYISLDRPWRYVDTTRPDSMEPDDPTPVCERCHAEEARNGWVARVRRWEAAARQAEASDVRYDGIPA